MYHGATNTLLTCMRFLLAALLLAGTYVADSTHDAPLEAGLTGSLNPIIEAAKPINAPTWNARYAAQFPGCNDTLHGGDVVFIDQDNTAHRITFDRAWSVTHDHNTANDGWIIGWC